MQTILRQTSLVQRMLYAFAVGRLRNGLFSATATLAVSTLSVAPVASRVLQAKSSIILYFFISNIKLFRRVSFWLVGGI